MSKTPGKWLHHLSKAEKADVYSCINTIQAQITRQGDGEITGDGILSLQREDIDFGSFTEKLLEIRNDVYNGQGFWLIRGFPIEDYTREEIMILNYSIGMILGIPNAQNTKVSLTNILCVCAFSFVGKAGCQ